MTDIEPIRKRCREICRLGLALSKNPEHLLGSGDPRVANWQTGKLENHRLRVLHMVLNRCGLLWSVSYICKYFKLLVPLKAYQSLLNNSKQHAEPSLAHQSASCFATHKSPNPSKCSGHSNNAEPSLQIFVDLSRLGSVSVMSKLTSQNEKNIYQLF